MALEKFMLGTLATMDDGRINAAFNAALKRVEMDCHDRPGVKTARKIEIVMLVEPVADEGELDSVNVSFVIKDNVPKRQSKAYNMRAERGGLIYNEVSPEDVRQLTLDMVPRPTAQVETSSRKEKEVASAL